MGAALGSSVALHGLAVLAAAGTGLLLVLSLGMFGTLPGIATALALPVLLAGAVLRDKHRKLLFLLLLLLPVAAINLPPRRLGLSLADLLIAGLATVVALRIMLGEDATWRLERTVFTAPFLLLVAAALVSTIFGIDTKPPTYELAVHLEYAAYYVIFVNVVRSASEIRLVCHLLIVGSVPTVLLGLAQFFFGIGLDFNPDLLTDNTSLEATGISVVRSFSTFSESLVFAQYLLVPLALIAALAVYAEDARRLLLHALLFTLGVIALVLTLSRGAWGALLVALALLAWLRMPKGLLFFLGLTFSALAVAVVAYWQLVQELVPASVAFRFDAFEADFFIGRGYLWTAIPDIVASHPLFGVGLRNLYSVVPDHAPSMLYAAAYTNTIGLPPAEAALVGHMHVDNFYLTILAELGICGLLPVLALAFIALRQALRNFHAAPPGLAPYALGVLCGLAGLLLNMATTYAYSDVRLALLLWTLLGLTVALQRISAGRAGP